MNGRIGAGRTAAGPGRVAIAVTALGLGVLSVVAGTGPALGLGESAGPVELAAGPAVVAAAGSTCAAEAPVRTFPQVRRGIAPGTMRAV